MFYLTGDTHGKFERIEKFCYEIGTTTDDVLIILGEAGINSGNNVLDVNTKEYLSKLPITLFCVHGNHEQRPETIETYKEQSWNEGIVFVEEQYPSLLFAKDGEVFNFDGQNTLVIGGAYSTDKLYRIVNRLPWWSDEQPSDSIKKRTIQNIKQYKNSVDVVLTHTCPFSYEPRECYLKGIEQSSVDKSTELWLDKIEKILCYREWYCGHWHTVKTVNKINFMFENYDVLVNDFLED